MRVWNDDHHHCRRGRRFTDLLEPDSAAPARHFNSPSMSLFVCVLEWIDHMPMMITIWLNKKKRMSGKMSMWWKKCFKRNKCVCIITTFIQFCFRKFSNSWNLLHLMLFKLLMMMIESRHHHHHHSNHSVWNKKEKQTFQLHWIHAIGICHRMNGMWII